MTDHYLGYKFSDMINKYFMKYFQKRIRVIAINNTSTINNSTLFSTTHKLSLVADLLSEPKYDIVVASDFFSGDEKEVLITLYALFYNKKDPFDTLIMDEPWTGLHPTLCNILIQELLTHHIDKTILIITHRSEFIQKSMAPYIYIFSVDRGYTILKYLNDLKIDKKPWYEVLSDIPFVFSNKVIFLYLQ
jgi:predicted ATP-dependent endonuclease of OLD family